MKWSNFIEQEDCVLVRGIGKGNKEFRQKISKDFYKELLTLKQSGVDQVFQLSSKNLHDMMERLKAQMNLPEERGIVFHSIRKSGSTWRYRITGGDIMEVKRSLNHSNLNTTQLYLANQDYGSAIGAVSSGGQINHNLYKEVDHETLLKAVENLSKDQQLILNLKLKELISNI